MAWKVAPLRLYVGLSGRTVRMIKAPITVPSRVASHARFTLSGAVMPRTLAQDLPIFWRQTVQAPFIEQRRPDEEAATRAVLAAKALSGQWVREVSVARESFGGSPGAVAGSASPSPLT